MRLPFSFIFAKLRGAMRQRLARNLGWYGAAELASRITRLLTTIIVARLTMRTDLGCAAAVLTGFELIRVLTNNGIGQAIIRATDDELDAICETAYRAIWVICIAVALLQAAAGATISFTGHGPGGWMLASLSGVYLIMAPGLVPVFLIQRANRLHVTAAIATTQMVADNIITAALAFAGAGAWALILPKLVVAPIWLIGVKRAQQWRPVNGALRAPLRGVLRFAVPVLGSEIVNTARLNLDNVLVGAVLGLQALGTYYFVFNAGIGLSLSLTSALRSALFPHLAENAPGRAVILQRFDHSILTAVLPIAGIIAVQAAGSLVYVPYIFGTRWIDAAPLVAILCASAIARPFADAGCELLRACGRTGQEFFTSLGATCIYLFCFGLALHHGLSFAIMVLAVTATLLHVAVGASARLSLAPRHPGLTFAQGVSL